MADFDENLATIEKAVAAVEINIDTDTDTSVEAAALRDTATATAAVVGGSSGGRQSKQEKAAAKKLLRKQAKQHGKPINGKLKAANTLEHANLTSPRAENIFEGICAYLGCVETDVTSMCCVLCSSGEPVATRLACYLSEELLYAGTCNMFNGRQITKRIWTIARFHVFPRNNDTSCSTSARTSTSTNTSTSTITSTSTSNSSNSSTSSNTSSDRSTVETFDVSLRVEKDPKNFQVLFTRERRTQAYVLFELEPGRGFALRGMRINKVLRSKGLARLCLLVFMQVCLRLGVSFRAKKMDKPLLAWVLTRLGFEPVNQSVELLMGRAPAGYTVTHPETGHPEGSVEGDDGDGCMDGDADGDDDGGDGCTGGGDGKGEQGELLLLWSNSPWKLRSLFSYNFLKSQGLRLASQPPAGWDSTAVWVNTAYRAPPQNILDILLAPCLVTVSPLGHISLSETAIRIPVSGTVGGPLGDNVSGPASRSIEKSGARSTNGSAVPSGAVGESARGAGSDYRCHFELFPACEVRGALSLCDLLARVDPLASTRWFLPK